MQLRNSIHLKYTLPPLAWFSNSLREGGGSTHVHFELLPIRVVNRRIVILNPYILYELN
jgi:hypothetical protein